MEFLEVAFIEASLTFRSLREAQLKPRRQRVHETTRQRVTAADASQSLSRLQDNETTRLQVATAQLVVSLTSYLVVLA